MQTTPDPGALANRHLRLARTSLLLSLAPLVALGLGVLEALVPSVLPVDVFWLLNVVVFGWAIIGPWGAVITGVWALRGNQQQPPLQPTVRAAAVAGVVIGIAGILLFVIGCVFLARLHMWCSTSPGECA
jgi:hypothetical protein